uniref:Uncharacterized protein n=1 Tax=Romanomermis culicivorax TaxID=13658 RepID=A0A915I5R2_ROMCU
FDRSTRVLSEPYDDEAVKSALDPPAPAGARYHGTGAGAWDILKEVRQSLPKAHASATLDDVEKWSRSSLDDESSSLEDELRNKYKSSSFSFNFCKIVRSFKR